MNEQSVLLGETLDDLPTKYTEVEKLAQRSLRSQLGKYNSWQARAAAHSGEPGVRQDVLATMRSHGWEGAIGIADSEALRLATIVAEELGRTAIPLPFINRFVEAPGVVQCTASSASAGAQAATASPWAVAEATLTRGGGGVRVSGWQRHVPHLDLPASTLLVVPDSGQFVVVEVPRDTTNVTPEISHSLGGDRLGALRLDNASFAPSRVIGRLDAPEFESALSMTRLAYCGEAVGVMAGSLDLAADYVSTRAAYGGKLIDLQVVRHQLADMVVDIEVCRWSTLWAASDPRDRFSTLCTTALVSDAVRHVAGQAMHLHGAIGLSSEHDMPFYSHRAFALAARLRIPAEPKLELQRFVSRDVEALHDF